MKETEKIGEVLEATTTGFTAQSYELFQLPPLGSLVKTGDGQTTIYGIVAGAETGGIEPGRRPIARGKDAENDDAIYKENPQLAKLLKSEFSVLVIGHKTDSKIKHYLSPRPARLHNFVFPCSDEEIRQFSGSFGFLSLIIKSGLPVPADELTAACLRLMSLAHEDGHRFLISAGKELATQLTGEMNRLKAILERIKQ